MQYTFLLRNKFPGFNLDVSVLFVACFLNVFKTPNDNDSPDLTTVISGETRKK